MGTYPFAAASSSGTGLVPSSPVTLAPVQWAKINSDTRAIFDLGSTYIYNNGTLGVGATLTAGSNGVLTADSGNPSAGDRILILDPYNRGFAGAPFPDGVYTVTSVGSVSTPWVLTRATDCNTAALLGRFWGVEIIQGTIFAGGWSVVQALSDTEGAQTFVVGQTFMGFSIAATSAYSAGPWNTASGGSSTALGTQASALGNNAVAIGNTSLASGIGATSIGPYSNAQNQYATSLGYQSYANGIEAVSVGPFSVAYANGQMAEASNFNNIQGDAQGTRWYGANETTDATPTALVGPFSSKLKFQDRGKNDDYSKTMRLTMAVVARRIDSPGNDAVFDATGYLSGNGSNTYTWIGGAPSFTKTVTNGTTTGWAVSVAVATNIVTITVTGAAASTICWSSKTETLETAG